MLRTGFDTTFGLLRVRPAAPAMGEDFSRQRTIRRTVAHEVAWQRSLSYDLHAACPLHDFLWLIAEVSMGPTDSGIERTKTRQSLLQIFDLLRSSYGPQHWWPGDSPFEVIVGAVLTQNTAWHNVAQAIANLKREGLLQRGALLRAEPDMVKALLAPAGYYNIKYDRLMGLLRFLDGYDMDLERLRSHPLETLRAELLEVKGVGPETADSILLYALERPVFVVDAYTRRLFSRLGYGWLEAAPYEQVQRFFMGALPQDTALYNEFHAFIVVHSKDTCRKEPMCEACCLLSLCEGGQRP
jgi:endonuclease-3 related protein